MKRNIKKYYYLAFILLTGLISISCSTMGSDYGYDSDEEIRKQRKNVTVDIRENNKKIEDAEQKINYEEKIKDELGENNEHLSTRIKENKEQSLGILQEIYDDSKYRTTYPATCRSCGKHVSISYSKFYEIAERYNTGGTRHYTVFYTTSYKWFLWWEWGHRRTKTGERTDSFEFHECPECIFGKGIAYFLKSIDENIEKIKLAEKAIFEEKAKIKTAQDRIGKDTATVGAFDRGTHRKVELKNEMAREKKIAEENLRKAKEAEEREKQKERERQEEKKKAEKAEKEAEEARRAAEEKEKENALLKEEQARLKKEQEEFKKKEEERRTEREKAEASLKEEREKLEKEKEKRKNKKEKKRKKEHEEILNTAKLLLKNGLGIDPIMSITKLSREEIENLQNDL